MKMRVQGSVETPGTIYQSTWCNMPDYLNLLIVSSVWIHTLRTLIMLRYS